MLKFSHGTLNNYCTRVNNSYKLNTKVNIEQKIEIETRASIKKMNLYFTYESRDTLKSFTLGHLLYNAQNLVISRCCFAEDGKEMCQEL